ARVLRPGGVFGLLWSGPDRQIPWVAELLGHPWPADADDSAEHRRRRAMVLPPGLPFSAPEGGVVRFSRSFRPDELAGLSGTYSVVITGGAQERAGRMERVEHRVRSLFGDGPVEVPMLCRCWRTVRTVGATQLG
ncbi:MAG TPA: hypothetical protein VMB82_13600, partial [Acidimicrobiales bacterium]|nr:hypothetical protein [Acidimicrobiales bacterium]